MTLSSNLSNHKLIYRTFCLNDSSVAVHQLFITHKTHAVELESHWNTDRSSYPSCETAFRLSSTLAYPLQRHSWHLSRGVVYAEHGWRQWSRSRSCGHFSVTLIELWMEHVGSEGLKSCWPELLEIKHGVVFRIIYSHSADCTEAVGQFGICPE